MKSPFRNRACCEREVGSKLFMDMIGAAVTVTVRSVGANPKRMMRARSAKRYSLRLSTKFQNVLVGV